MTDISNDPMDEVGSKYVPFDLRDELVRTKKNLQVEHEHCYESLSETQSFLMCVLDLGSTIGKDISPEDEDKVCQYLIKVTNTLSQTDAARLEVDAARAAITEHRKKICSK